MSNTADNVEIGGTLAVTGATTLTGAITATGGVTGAVTGNVTGDLTGDTSGATVAATTSITSTGPNGSSVVRGYVTELVTLAQAATTSSTIEIPADCHLLAVSVIVVAVTATTATYEVGITGDTARFVTSINDTANASDAGIPDARDLYSSTTTVLITPNANPSDDLGRIRLVIWYDVVTAPTS